MSVPALARVILSTLPFPVIVLGDVEMMDACGSKCKNMHIVSVHGWVHIKKKYRLGYAAIWASGETVRPKNVPAMGGENLSFLSSLAAFFDVVVVVGVLVHDPTGRPSFQVIFPENPGKHAQAEPGCLLELGTLHGAGLVSWISINACMTRGAGVQPV